MGFLWALTRGKHTLSLHETLFSWLSVISVCPAFLFISLVSPSQPPFKRFLDHFFPTHQYSLVIQHLFSCTLPVWSHPLAMTATKYGKWIPNLYPLPDMGCELQTHKGNSWFLWRFHRHLEVNMLKMQLPTFPLDIESSTIIDPLIQPSPLTAQITPVTRSFGLSF